MSKFDYVENKARMKSAAVRTMCSKIQPERINSDMSNIAKNLNVKSSKIIFKRKTSGSHERVQTAGGTHKRSIEIPHPHEQSSEGTGATPDHSPMRTRLGDTAQGSASAYKSKSKVKYSRTRT